MMQKARRRKIFWKPEDRNWKIFCSRKIKFIRYRRAVIILVEWVEFLLFTSDIWKKSKDRNKSQVKMALPHNILRGNLKQHNLSPEKKQFSVVWRGSTTRLMHPKMAWINTRTFGKLFNKTKICFSLQLLIPIFKSSKLISFLVMDDTLVFWFSVIEFSFHLRCSLSDSRTVSHCKSAFTQFLPKTTCFQTLIKFIYFTPLHATGPFLYPYKHWCF